MPTFRKRPITVEAIQWTGDNFDEIAAFTTAQIEQRPLTDKLFIPTLEGTLRAKVGDWIVKGVRGEVWPVEESIFPETYDEVIENACPACKGSRYADYAAVPCERCLGAGTVPGPPTPIVTPITLPFDPLLSKKPKPLAYRWPWSRYISFWAWLRYGFLIYWRCAQCRKRHLSTPRGFDKHIGYDVPLCTACEDETDRSYNEHMRREADEREYNDFMESLFGDDDTIIPLTREEQALMDQYDAEMVREY